MTVFFNGPFSTKGTSIQRNKKAWSIQRNTNESPEKIIPEEAQFPDPLNKTFKTNALNMLKKERRRNAKN